MDDITVQQRITKLLLQRYNLRVQPEMGLYVMRKLRASANQTIPVMGGDARTGVAIRQLLAAADLQSAITAAPALLV